MPTLTGAAKSSHERRILLEVASSRLNTAANRLHNTSSSEILATLHDIEALVRTAGVDVSKWVGKVQLSSSSSLNRQLANQ